ncbi:glutaredoxin family protein [Candidatus Aenigmatarchaeota archaeon]
MTVKVYTTNTCPYCTMVKDFLKKQNVKFEEINVETDQKAAEEMIEKSGQMGVPVVDVNGTIIVGFNKPAIEEALAKEKK